MEPPEPMLERSRRPQSGTKQKILYYNVPILASIIACSGLQRRKYCARGLLMDESIKPASWFPQAYCVFCTRKTPHVHERLAIEGKQVMRSLCLSCKREQPKEKFKGRS